MRGAEDRIDRQERQEKMFLPQMEDRWTEIRKTKFVFYLCPSDFSSVAIILLAFLGVSAVILLSRRG
jgi:hypothetical protein